MEPLDRGGVLAWSGFNGFMFSLVLNTTVPLNKMLNETPRAACSRITLRMLCVSMDVRTQQYTQNPGFLSSNMARKPGTNFPVQMCMFH